MNFNLHKESNKEDTTPQPQFHFQGITWHNEHILTAFNIGGWSIFVYQDTLGNIKHMDIKNDSRA